ncbi:MAG: NAD kinase [Bacteroidales bacterium]
MHIAVYGRKFGKQFIPFAEKLFERLRHSNIKISIYRPFYEFMRNRAGMDPLTGNLFNSHEDIDKNIDYVFSIGGDGTILETITIVRDSGIPVLGINSGRLGFLANISREDIDLAIDALVSGNYSTEKRSLLELSSPSDFFGDFRYALNEFTLQKKDSAMITIQAWLNDRFLNSYWADGLIVSTPTGSTAYSLSVGGPLLTTETKGFVISPIAPHNLTVRPIVIPDSNIIRMKVHSRNGEFLLSMDYRSTLVPVEKEIILKRSEFDISLIRLNNQDFFTTLRNKLMWGLDKRNMEDTLS